MKIIINCDDLGASPEVNASIFALMEQRCVTSASLLMNAPAIEAAASQLCEYRHCSFGVHLNLTDSAPLTAHPGLTPLLNDSGEFAGNARRIPLTAAIRRGVFAEWCAQVERAVALGVPVSHLDSHHHVHTEPRLFLVLKDVQRKFGIRKVRLTRNMLGCSESVPMALALSKASWNFLLRHYYRTTTTDGFTAFSTFLERLHAGLDWQGTIELMCHPGGELFEGEYDLLRTPWRDDLARGAQLISYNEL